jgi:hypothetical protein
MYCVLQSRGVSLSDEATLRGWKPPATLNMSCGQVIKYCPFCGQLLVELIQQHKEAYRKIAAKHEDLRGGGIL